MPMARDATPLAVPDGWRVVRLGECATGPGTAQARPRVRSIQIFPATSASPTFPMLAGSGPTTRGRRIQSGSRAMNCILVTCSSQKWQRRADVPLPG